MSWRNLILVFSVVRFAVSAEDEQERLLQSDTVKVIIGLKDDPSTSPAFGEEFKSIKSEFQRANAITKTILVSEFATYENDPNVDYIEIDHPVKQFAEETPWGIAAVQADVPMLIPLSDPNEDCFKICIIDSGLLVAHPDLVSRSACGHY